MRLTKVYERCPAMPVENHIPVATQGALAGQVLEDLLRELREWKIIGKVARFWWRDDDASKDTTELRRLLVLAENVETAVGLAVIPQQADQTLAKLISEAPCCVWQHGWRHLWQYDGVAGGYSQGEFGTGRTLELMMVDAQRGQEALDHIFGEAGWQRVFVPPFHALSPEFKSLLPSLGYCGLSAGLPLTPLIDTIAEVNAETDLMHWPTRRFAGSQTIVTSLVEQLQTRRQGLVSPHVPIGILSHHLAHDEDAWQFLTDLLSLLKSHSATELVPANVLFSPSTKTLPTRLQELADVENIKQDGVSVVVTSCGRQDLLEITLDSFLRHNTYPIAEFIIVEDGDGEINRTLVEKYRSLPFRWLATGKRVGQVAAIDMAYRAIRTQFIFHCEDDWEFFAPGFVEKSLAVMRLNYSVLQVWVRAQNDTNRHPLINYTLLAEGIPYYLLRHHHDARDWGTWHGFSWNPGLRRWRDYVLLGSFETLDPGTNKETWRVESDASSFYQRHGFYAAILADNGGNGYVRHIGGGRRVPRDYIGRATIAPPLGSLDPEGAGHSERSGAATPIIQHNHYANVLLKHLAARPRFASLPQHCGDQIHPGRDEVPTWQVWTSRETTPGQLKIEDLLEKVAQPASRILHVGVGNSGLAGRLAPLVSSILGTTLHDRERIFSHRVRLSNYSVLTANKFSEKMDRINGQFDFIVDNNPSSFCCCLFHFSRMIVAYFNLLARDGGLLLTEKSGLGWVCPGNDPNWSFSWEDWALLGQILGMPVQKMSTHVYSIQRLPESGILFT